MLMLNMILDIIRSLLFFFDQIIYGFIPTLYKFIELLALQKLFTEESLQDLAGNVYAVLGVFMLFRLAFVLLNAIIDPDKLNDKQKGFPKMLGRVVVALVLIVAIPWAFSFAYKLQSTIIKENLIGKIILGSDATLEQDPGQQMGEMALKAFLSCNPSVPIGTGDKQCDDNALQTDGFDKAFPSVNAETGTTGAASFEYLSTHLNDEAEPTGGEEGEVYKYSYTAGISTIAGGFILAMLIVFVFDIATRVVKLGFLQLIAPVAVIGYIEPDGGMFNRWLKMCTSTYLNLFVRILSITFVVYVLSLLGDSLIFDSITDENGLDAVKAFTKVFIIFGALLFAKEAPAMIKTLFDLKEDSIGTLNPMKKLGGMAGAGIIGGASALALKPIAGGIGAAGGAYQSWKNNGSIRAGAMEGLTKGAKNVSGKGGIGNLNKQLLGTAGAWRQGANAGATLATGKETKTGFFTDMSQNYHDKASKLQRDYATQSANEKGRELFDKYNEAKKQNATNPYASLYSNKYAATMKSLDDYKKQSDAYGNQREFFANRYRLNPTGKFQYKDTEGNLQELTNKEAYEKANSNSLTAEKYVNSTNATLAEMDKVPEFKEDASNRALFDSYKKQQIPDFKDIPSEYTSNSGSGSTGPGPGYTTNSKGEKTTNSGIILPNNYNDKK